MSIYTYEKLCDSERLKQEIQDSIITVALDYITTASSPEETSVYFKATLSTEAETLLDSIVTAHENEPLPENIIAQVELVQKDMDTEAVSTTQRLAPQGWHQVYHEIEFKTSQLNGIHDRSIDDDDNGYSTAKFYNASDVELTTQGTIDTDCVKTVFDFTPTFSYAIKSGQIAQIESPTVPVYFWAVAGPSMIDIVFSDGGINLEFLHPKTLVGMDGSSATLLPAYLPIRFVVRHPEGFKHRIQAIFEYFRA